MPKIAIIYSTFAKKSDAAKVTQQLMRQRLVACGVISGPVTSTYFWKGKTPTEKEYVLTMKTTTGNVQKAKRALLAVHPYDVPCILSWTVDANDTYAKWVKKETNSRK